MFSGRCECGRAGYRVDGEVENFSHCHCSQCRRLHGAAYVSFAGVRQQDFRYTSGTEDLCSYRSSEGSERVFCGVCGSSMLVTLDSEPDAMYVALGTADEAPELPPAYHIFVGSKAAWHRILDDAPQYDTEPGE